LVTLLTKILNSQLFQRDLSPISSTSRHIHILKLDDMNATAKQLQVITPLHRTGDFETPDMDWAQAQLGVKLDPFRRRSQLNYVLA
jgi:hypothetical protein